NHVFTESTAIAAGFPMVDDYRLLLTKDPGAETITIKLKAEPTRTSRTGGIRAFTEQVKLCVVTGVVLCNVDGDFSLTPTVTFTETPPDTAATVTIDASKLRGIGTCANELPAFDPGCVTGDGTHNEIQYLDVRATGGTFTLWLDVNGDTIHDAGETTDPIAF